MPTAAAALLEAEASDGAAYLHTVAQTLSQQGIQAHAAVERGEAVRTLLNAAAAREIDLIILATHGRSGVGAMWAGSVAQRIIVQSPRPVLLVRIAAPAS
jgi:nucleotide-binding universal stress UspA family protein